MIESGIIATECDLNVMAIVVGKEDWRPGGKYASGSLDGSGGKVEIKGGTISGRKTLVSVDGEDAVLTIEGDATIVGEMPFVIVKAINGGTVNVKGGKLTSKLDALIACDGGKINITGGEINVPSVMVSGNSTRSFAWAALAGYTADNKEAEINISGGIINGGSIGIDGPNKKVNISGGTINSVGIEYWKDASTGKEYTENFSIIGGDFTKIDPTILVPRGYAVLKFNGTYPDGAFRVCREDNADEIKEATQKADAVLETIKESKSSNEALKEGSPLANALTDVLTDNSAETLEKLDTIAEVTATITQNDDVIAELASVADSDPTGEETKELIMTIVAHKISADKEAQVEAQSGEVKDTTTPAGTDLLAASNTASEALKTANENLSAQPKVIAPTPMTREAVKTLQNNLSLLETSKVADKAIDQKALEAVKNAAENLKTRNDIEILSADSVISEQAKAIESVFEDVQENLASVPNAGGGNGVVIASVLPPMIPRISGFFPLKINLRNLMPGRKLMFWPSTAYFNNYADSPAAANASLAAIDGDGTEGKEGDFFFLDENQVPVTKVTGDASKMTVVAYLEEDGDYSSAFITADATEKDVAALETLAADSSSGGGDSKPETPGGGDNNPSDGSNNGGGGTIPENPSNGGDDGRGGTDDGAGGSDSSGSGGGCDLGFSVLSLALMALAGAKLAKRR